MATLSYPLLKGALAQVTVDLRTGKGVAYAAVPWQQWFYELWQRQGGAIAPALPELQVPEYLLGVAAPTLLPAARVVTDTPTLAWDSTTAGQAKASVPDDSITYAKMQPVSASDRVLGRFTPGVGDVEEIPCTAAGRALLAAASASAQRTTLGLGTMATQNAAAVAITGGTIDDATLTDATITGGAIDDATLTDATITGGAITGVSSLGVSSPETYTVTNGTLDRAYDANTVTVAELADIVYSLITDLQARGILA